MKGHSAFSFIFCHAYPDFLVKVKALHTFVFAKLYARVQRARRRYSTLVELAAVAGVGSDRRCPQRGEQKVSLTATMTKCKEGKNSCASDLRPKGKSVRMTRSPFKYEEFAKTYTSKNTFNLALSHCGNGEKLSDC